MPGHDIEQSLLIFLYPDGDCFSLSIPGDHRVQSIAFVVELEQLGFLPTVCFCLLILVQHGNGLRFGDRVPVPVTRLPV